jgi:hypothetical protein
MTKITEIDPSTLETAVGVAALEIRIRHVLASAPDPNSPEPTGFKILERIGDRIRPRSGLSREDIIKEAEIAMLAAIPEVTVADIEPEITATGELQSLDVGFAIIATGELGRLQIEYSTSSRTL